jgi:hypothetical protein
VGRLLDINEGQQAWIDQDDKAIQISWTARRGTTHDACYAWDEIELLDEVARLNRMADAPRRGRSGQVADCWSQLLRTVGQDLDQALAETSSVKGDLSRLSIHWDGRYGEQMRECQAAELWEANSRRAAQRRPDA